MTIVSPSLLYRHHHCIPIATVQKSKEKNKKEKNTRTVHHKMHAAVIHLVIVGCVVMCSQGCNSLAFNMKWKFGGGLHNETIGIYKIRLVGPHQLLVFFPLMSCKMLVAQQHLVR